MCMTLTRPGQAFAVCLWTGSCQRMAGFTNQKENSQTATLCKTVLMTQDLAADQLAVCGRRPILDVPRLPPSPSAVEVEVPIRESLQAFSASPPARTPYRSGGRLVDMV